MTNGSTQRTCQAAAILYGVYEPCTQRVPASMGIRLCATHLVQVEDHIRKAKPPQRLKVPTAQRNLIAENQSLVGQLADQILEVKRLQALPPEQRVTPRPKAERPKDGFIYFLRSSGYVKIGWTSDLEKRMKAYPPDTQLLAVKPGTRKDENALHRKFAHLLTYGREWFPLAPQVTEEVDRVVAEFGPPPIVDFSARKAQRIVGPRLNKYVGGPNRGHLPARTVAG